jgi:hypothetical protein
MGWAGSEAAWMLRNTINSAPAIFFACHFDRSDEPFGLLLHRTSIQDVDS